MVGIDLATGEQKFNVPIDIPSDSLGGTMEQPIIAGDGNAYLLYGWGDGYDSGNEDDHLRLLQISSSGVYNTIDVLDLTTPYSEMFPCGSDGMITNGATGVLLSWGCWDGSPTGILGLAVTSGTGVSLINGSQMPDQDVGFTPVLQAQDGSFIGTTIAGDDWTPYMIAFDGSGNLLWSASAGGDYFGPQIATADGGVIATDLDTGVVETFDQNGNVTGQMASLQPDAWAYSWTQQWYSSASGQTADVALPMIEVATSFGAFDGGNASANNAAAQPLPDSLRATSDFVKPDGLGAGAILRDITYQPFQAERAVPPSKNVTIKENLIYSYGQQPQASSATGTFEDIVGTEGKGSFGLTQQFFLGVPGYRDYRVQIVPCVATNTFGAPTWRNLINATDQTVMINGDPGTTDGRSCHPQ
jgi:hypothetical protein